MLNIPQELLEPIIKTSNLMFIIILLIAIILTIIDTISILYFKDDFILFDEILLLSFFGFIFLILGGILNTSFIFIFIKEIALLLIMLVPRNIALRKNQLKIQKQKK